MSGKAGGPSRRNEGTPNGGGSESRLEGVEQAREWWFGDIPSDWRRIPLKHLCKRLSLYGANISANEYTDSGVRFIRTTDIREDGSLAGAGVFIPDDLVADYMLSDGDFLISRSGTVGLAYVYSKTDGPCSYAGYLIRYVLSEPSTAKWLYYLTKSVQFRAWVLSASVEATISNVNGEKYANLMLPVPKSSARVAIAKYLDAETTRIDALIAAKENMLAVLTEKRRAVITHAVTRGLDPNVPMRDSGVPWLGEVPAHWEVTRLKFVADVQSGFALGKKYDNEPLAEYPYLRVANVQDGFLDLTEVKTIEVSHRDAQTCQLRPGDVLMNEGGDADKLGRGAIWRGEIDPCLHQNHVFAVRPRQVTSDWLNLWTCSEGAKGFFGIMAKQSTNLASISATNLKELPIPKPPTAEQVAIVQHVDTELSKFDACVGATELTIQLLRERREAIITAAVTGQLTLEST